MSGDHEERYQTTQVAAGEEDGIHFIPPQALVVEVIEPKAKGQENQGQEDQPGRVNSPG
jgi:hypothetical protein